LRRSCGVRLFDCQDVLQSGVAAILQPLIDSLHRLVDIIGISRAESHGRGLQHPVRIAGAEAQDLLVRPRAAVADVLEPGEGKNVVVGAQSGLRRAGRGQRRSLVNPH